MSGVPEGRGATATSPPSLAHLLSAKRRFLVPATLFFLAYYFALPVLVGYAPELMATKVWGNVNLAYLFALSQFGMAWGLAWLYVRRARRFDALAEELVRAAEARARGAEDAGARP